MADCRHLCDGRERRGPVRAHRETGERQWQFREGNEVPWEALNAMAHKLGNCWNESCGGTVLAQQEMVWL